MSDASMPLPAGAPLPISAAPVDPLAGDWSEGLPGPLRALPVPQPRLLAIEVATQAPADALAAPPSWEAATDPLHSTASPAEPRPEMVADVPTAPAQDAPTPWSEPVAQAAEAVEWQAPVENAWADAASPEAAALPEAPAAEAPAETAHDAWLAPPPAEQNAEDAWAAPAEVMQDWEPEAAASSVESAPRAAAVPDAPPPDWSTLESGPDWSAPPEAGAPAQDAWDAPPPSPAAPAWMATPADPEPVSDAHVADAWTAPAAGAPEPEWAADPAPARAPAAAAGPAWNAPSVGASALEQLDSDPPEPEPGAAEELFGSVPEGESLSGDDREVVAEMLAAGEPAIPEVLASAEDVLKPVDPHDDPDLPVALDEPVPAPKLLAALRPATVGALEVAGEHRVAVHTRGGRTLRGTVRDVDLSKSQFALQPQGGGSTEIIYHSDVKVIFFMLAPGEKVKAADGSRVRVKLSDGRVIAGDRDGAEARHGFFLVPGDAARTNTRRIYVAREAADEIEG